MLREYETLIRRINRTNAATAIGADSTLTDELARDLRELDVRQC